MPDKRRQRGPHPQDRRLFAPEKIDPLRNAVSDLSWLLTRGYSQDGALKLVGDRFALTKRQRLAVLRSACSDESIRRRKEKCVPVSDLRGRALTIDGYNLLITIESALSGGVILIGRDGCYRDLASVHGTYRKVGETEPAIRLILNYLESLEPRSVRFLLDRPVSNSGRLKAFMETLLPDDADPEVPAVPIVVELVESPDKIIVKSPGTAITSDSAILDCCAAWANLAEAIICRKIPAAWKVNLE